MSIMQNTTSCIKEEWKTYSERAESHYLENTASVESGKENMVDVLKKWLVSYSIHFPRQCRISSKSSSLNLEITRCSLEQAKLGEQQWNSAQESLLSLEKRNVASVHEIVR